MTSGDTSNRIVDVEASVRHNTGAAAVSAGLLIFFGFIYPFARHTAPGLFAAGESLLFFALQLGGIAMVAITIWLSLGHLPAMIADAVISTLVGLMVVIAGVLMLIDGGWWLQAMIIVVSGGTFLSSGLRNARDFLDLSRIDVADDKDEEEDISVLSAADDSPLTSDIPEQRSAPKHKAHEYDQPELVDMEGISRPPKRKTPKRDQPIQLDGLTPPPPDGPVAGQSSSSADSYLAKLARKDKSTGR